nr:hypothetical protein CFP56_08851 [Quercus suber]
MWMMRQVSIRVVASTNSLLLSNSIITSQFPISFSFYPKSQYLISLVSSSHRHSLSTTTASSSSSHFGDVEEIGVSKNGSNSKTLLKGLTYSEFENWVQLQGYRPGQALMLWKRLYGNDIWAHQIDELEGLNKDFKKMLSENAEFKALSLKEILTASDGTKKEVADFIHIGRWTGDRDCCHTLR